MELSPFKAILAMSKEKVAEVMAIPRARRMKAQAEVEMAELETDILTLKGKVEESLYDENSYKNFSWKSLMDSLDEIALLERRQQKYKDVLEQLFPETKTE